MAKKKAEELLNVGVAFGNVSIGDGTAALPIVIDRSDLPISRADRLFAGRRLTAEIAAGPTSEDPEQPVLFDDMDHHIAGIFDSKSLSVKLKTFSARLNLSLDDNAEALTHFAKRRGRLVVTEVTKVPDRRSRQGDADEEEEEAEE